MGDQWVLNTPEWYAPLILRGDDAALYRQYVNDQKQSRIRARAYWWVNDPWVWLVRVGSVLALLFYTLGGGDAIGWVIGLAVLFLVSCGSCFICMQREENAEKAILMIKDRQDFQELQQRIYEYDQQQLKVYENRVRKGLGLDEKETPKRVMTTSSRVKRDNFKLTRY
tara:strand:+ start:1146 stop:1649 length:504 start_codon:yes stop_codon:yes gene_type:complete